MIFSIVKTTGLVIFLSFKYLIKGIIHIFRRKDAEGDSE